MSNSISISKAKERLASRQTPTTSLAYEAVANTERRKTKQAGQKPHADRVLDVGKRKIGENAAQDALENIPLAGWMIRRHLDSVANFYFEVDTTIKDEKVRKQILDLLEWHGKARNFDAARRHSRDEMVRLLEIAKVIDGDGLWSKITRKNSPRYGSVQLFEGTRIKKPTVGLPKYLAQEGVVTDLGLELDEYGGVKSYIVCKYNKRGTNLEFDRRIMSKDAIYSGYFERYAQTRGVSPLMAAINSLLDIKESQEFQMLKIKLHALFGVAITTKMLDAETGDGLPSSASGVEDESGYDADESTADVQREIDFSKGPMLLNLDEGEDAKTIESNTPPESVKAFTELAIRCALLAFDIPYTMFDGNKSTFAQVVADRKLYSVSVLNKRKKNKEVLEQYLDWKLADWCENGDIDADYLDIRDSVKVCSMPDPWLDAVNEIQFEERAIAIGLKSIPGVARERGIDAFEVLEQQAQFLNRAKELNVPIYVGDPGARSERDNDLDNKIKKDDSETNDRPQN